MAIVSSDARASVPADSGQGRCELIQPNPAGPTSTPTAIAIPGLENRIKRSIGIENNPNVMTSAPSTVIAT